MRTKHRIFVEHCEQGNLAIIPSLNKYYLVDSKLVLQEYVLADEPLLENKYNKINHQLVLILTNNCNLACKYCYEYKNDRKKNEMSYEMIDSSINYFFNKSKSEAANKIKVALFGGEPTLAYKKLLYAIDAINQLSEKLDIKKNISIVTNGYIKNNLEKLAEIIDHFTISIDGPPDIQNVLRPTKNGKETYSVVSDTIEYLYKKSPRKLSFRITITPEYINDIKRISDYFATRYPNIPQAYEPVMSTDRYRTEIEIINFIEKLFSLQLINNESEYRISSSFFSLKPSLSFCGMENRFVVFPDGKVTGCHRINLEDSENSVSNHFHFGDFINGNFVEDPIGLNNSHKITMKGETGIICNDCFIKYYCRGGCVALKLSMGLQPSEKLPWCDNLKSFYKKYFLWKLGITN